VKKFRLLGVLCICVIALVIVSTNSNDPLVSSLLDIVFIISSAVLGLLLLRKTNISESLRVRRRDSRRFDLQVEFPLTDSWNVTVIQERRRLSDRRKAINNFVGQQDVLKKMVGS